MRSQKVVIQFEWRPFPWIIACLSASRAGRPRHVLFIRVARSLTHVVSVDLGYLLCSFVGLEEWLLFETKQFRRDYGWELRARGVVVLHRVVVILARDRDSVLGAGQLVLEFLKTFRRPQLRIVLCK